MVNQEILRIIEQISREKGIEKEVLLAGVEAAVLSAAKRRYGPAESLQAHFNPQSGMLDLTIAKTASPTRFHAVRPTGRCRHTCRCGDIGRSAGPRGISWGWRSSRSSDQAYRIGD